MTHPQPLPDWFCLLTMALGMALGLWMGWVIWWFVPTFHMSLLQYWFFGGRRDRQKEFAERLDRVQAQIEKTREGMSR